MTATHQAKEEARPSPSYLFWLSQTTNPVRQRCGHICCIHGLIRSTSNHPQISTSIAEQVDRDECIERLEAEARLHAFEGPTTLK
ncbi:hypothetical protein PGTUg99_035538 [Puccinia graminis f. sp. tritici]|uniref:Uncharacterized protein n=1 Tax=Puccinia graminis f. sp. tritici TaxID=56615 RepID=A0A5B0SB19_PUCGR|nr:hypothetical protein PGTUg99_035538 [Puccinia graminis f. sp. tritici]